MSDQIFCSELITLLIRKFILISLGSSAIAYSYFCLISPECSMLSLFFKTALIRRGKGKKGEKTEAIWWKSRCFYEGSDIKKRKREEGKEKLRASLQGPTGSQARSQNDVLRKVSWLLLFFFSFIKTEVNCPTGREISFAVCLIKNLCQKEPNALAGWVAVIQHFKFISQMSDFMAADGRVVRAGCVSPQLYHSLAVKPQASCFCS